MHCPYCTSKKTEVDMTEAVKHARRRERLCPECGRRFETWELRKGDKIPEYEKEKSKRESASVLEW